MHGWMVHSNSEGKSVWINNMLYGENQILWSGASYMIANQTATLSKKISEMPHGIVLCWSGYSNDEAKNYDWHCTFVPKQHVATQDGAGIGTGLMSNASMSIVGHKYVYVSDSSISGNDNNKNTKSSTQDIISEINNAHWVLRYVIGV